MYVYKCLYAGACIYNSKGENGPIMTKGFHTIIGQNSLYAWFIYDLKIVLVFLVSGNKQHYCNSPEILYLLCMTLLS